MSKSPPPSSSPTPTSKRPVVVDSTLSKGLLVLEALSHSSDGRGVSELSIELGLTKSNTFRLLQTLINLGYVRQLSNKTYVATLRMWRVGRRMVDHLNLREFCASEMQLLSQRTGETIYLAVREGIVVVYIDKIDSTKPIRSWNPIGGHAPLHCVGTGKALLAADYDFLREPIKSELKRYTSETITTISALDADVSQTLSRGYALDAGEFRERIYSFGAPIYLPNGTAIAAIGISVPDVNLAANDESKLGKYVMEAASRVTQRMSQT